MTISNGYKQGVLDLLAVIGTAMVSRVQIEAGTFVLKTLGHDVPPDAEADFRQMYADAYVPALAKQQGYLSSRLLRLFPPEMAREIEAAETPFNYQMELVFDTEENRRRWVASDEHGRVWPTAEQMARKAAWRGYDVVGADAAAG